MSKQTYNKSPKASQKLAEWAESLGLPALIIEKSKGQRRILHRGNIGTTSSPQKVIEIEGKRFSVGGAKQYLKAREKEAKAKYEQYN